VITALSVVGFSIRFMFKIQQTAEMKIMQQWWMHEYVEGLMFFAVATILCLIVRHTENVRNIENFVLFKDVEKKGEEIQRKNEQMQEELELASRVHQTLIPESIKTKNADVTVSYLPMRQVGGDYARFRFLDKDRLGFIVSDVTGHGVPAALLVNRVHSEFEHLIEAEARPGGLLSKLNAFITKTFSGTGMYLSAFCGLLDFRHRKMLFSNYGHPPQYLYQVKGDQIQRFEPQTCLIGISNASGKIYEGEIGFEKGDRILLFTDGVIEAANIAGERFGSARLENYLRDNNQISCEEFNQKLVNQLNSFHPGDFEDDIFVLNIKITK
jgi:serine phosphatase RsbU (regulator of sigma subunit)